MEKKEKSLGTENGLHFLHQGSISSTLYEQHLRPQIPKAQKDSQIVSFLCAFGSVHAKAACGTLMKLTTAVNFIIILCAHFLRKSFEQLFSA